VKIGLGALAFLLLAALVLPCWGGFEAEAAFSEMGSTLAKVSGGHASAETEFERGWLSSRAVTRVVIGENESVFELRHDIIHGPIPWGLLAEGRVPMQLVQGIVTTRWVLPAADAVLGEARTQIDFGGRTRVTFESPDYQQEQPPIRWGGARGTLLSPAPDFSEVTGLLEAPTLGLSALPGGAGPGLEVRDIVLAIDTQGEVGPGFAIGSISLSVGHAEVRGGDGALSASNLQWAQSGALDAEAGTYTLTLSGSLDQLLLGEERSYGPGALELVIRNLDPEAIGAVADDAQTAGAAAGTGDPVPDLDLALVTRVLERSPEIEIAHLQLEGPDGTLHATGRVGIDGESPQVAMGPMMAALAVEADADIFIPSRFLHRILDAFAAEQVVATGAEPAVSGARDISAAAVRTRWVEALLAAGVLTVEGDGYRVRIEYAEGSLRVNGRPFDPASLQSAQVAAL
jgi:uncharacterized protein YdgA (DUF945 family)